MFFKEFDGNLITLNIFFHTNMVLMHYSKEKSYINT